MSIRNENNNWTPKANEAYDEYINMMRPFYEKWRKEFSIEDIYYLCSGALYDIGLDEILPTKRSE